MTSDIAFSGVPEVNDDRDTARELRGKRHAGSGGTLT
jgi:hypothetical protein